MTSGKSNIISPRSFVYAIYGVVAIAVVVAVAHFELQLPYPWETGRIADAISHQLPRFNSDQNPEPNAPVAHSFSNGLVPPRAEQMRPFDHNGLAATNRTPTLPEVGNNRRIFTNSQGNRAFHAEQFLARGDTAYSEGAYSAAESYYEDAVRADPNSEAGATANTKLNSMMSLLAHGYASSGLGASSGRSVAMGAASGAGTMSVQSTQGTGYFSPQQALNYAVSEDRVGDMYLAEGQAANARSAYSHAVATAPTSSAGEYANAKIKQIDDQRTGGTNGQ